MYYVTKELSMIIIVALFGISLAIFLGLVIYDIYIRDFIDAKSKN